MSSYKENAYRFEPNGAKLKCNCVLVVSLFGRCFCVMCLC